MATLLILEDDIDTNEAVCEYLQEAGHSTISAFDGDEAITLFSENKIDLVVLDIMLPTITGLAVLNSIRKTSQVPVLMLTAMEDEQTQVASFDGQADDYIENDDFLPELELIGFSTLVSANKANLKDSSINIYTGIANVILLVSGTWQNSGVFYIHDKAVLYGHPGKADHRSAAPEQSG